MALDTLAKRASAINVSLPWRRTWPIPDGTLDAQDRAEILALYAGISFVATTNGTLDATEGPDSAALAGNVPISGTLAATEGADADDSAGTVLVQGTLAATEGADVADFVALLVVSAALAATEGADGAAFVGNVAVSGTLAVTEGADSSASSGAVLVSGTLAVTEGADADDTAGVVIVQGTLAVTEGADTADFNNFIESTGTLAATEGADTASFRAPTPFPRYRPQAEPVYLLEINVWNGLTLDTHYFSTLSICTTASDTPSDTTYLGRLKKGFEFTQLMFSNGGTVGKSSATVGYFELNNVDGDLDWLLDTSIAGWPFYLRYLADKDDAVSTATLMFQGTLRGFASKDMRRVIQLRVRDKLEELNTTFLTTRYAGSTNSSAATAEGDSTMANDFKPYAIGYNYQCPALPANSYDRIYQGSIKSQYQMFVSDGGVLLTAGSDYTTISALRSATVTAGTYATAKNLGLFRLGADPSKTVTVDLVSSSTESDLSVGAIAKQILLDAGVSSTDIDDASFDALTPSASTNLRCSFYVQDDSKTLDLVCKVLNSVGATIIATPDGKFKAVSLGTVPTALFPNPIFDDETEVDTFTNDDLINGSTFTLYSTPGQEGDAVPAWACSIKCIKHWHLLSKGDLATSLSAYLVNFYGKEYQQTSDGSSSIKTANPLSDILEFETLLATGTGGLIQAGRRFDYYGKRRDYLECSIRADRATLANIGDIVVVKPTDGDGDVRFGYGTDGKKMCVIGKSIVIGSPSVKFVFWG